MDHTILKLVAHTARKETGAESTVIRVARAVARETLDVNRLNKSQTAVVDEIARKTVARRVRRAEPENTRTQRLHSKLRLRYTAEIENRGGETEIEEGRGSIPLGITSRDPKNRLALLHAEGFRYYSRRFGSRHAALSYLCGTDDSGIWAVRVPGTIETVGAAITWIEVAAVRKAREAGRRVLRQGDVYAVETGNKKDRADQDDLPESHFWAHTSRIILHEGHAPMQVPYPCKFYRQNALEMGRSGRYGSAD